MATNPKDMQNQEQIRFKTAAGWLGYHSGMPEPNDPGMTEEDHAEWQKEVFMDALTPEDDCSDQTDLNDIGMQIDPNFFCLDEDDKERCKVQCPFCERI